MLFLGLQVSRLGIKFAGSELHTYLVIPTSLTTWSVLDAIVLLEYVMKSKSKAETNGAMDWRCFQKKATTRWY